MTCEQINDDDDDDDDDDDEEDARKGHWSVTQVHHRIKLNAAILFTLKDYKPITKIIIMSEKFETETSIKDVSGQKTMFSSAKNVALKSAKDL